jgi:hypothetical protein
VTVPSSERRPDAVTRRVFDLVVVGALALVAGVVGLVAVLDARIGAPDRSVAADLARLDAGASPTRQALHVLAEWDGRRAAAYAGGSPPALRRLYVAGSPAGIADLRLLSAYRARDLRVVAMRTQVLSLRVLDAGPDRWRLAVTDRLALAEVRRAGRGAAQPVALPRDLPTTHVVTLVRAGSSWRVLSVTEA